MSGIESRIRNLESVLSGEADTALAAEEQWLFYRGLHAHLADHDLFMWGAECEMQGFDDHGEWHDGEISDALQAEGEALLATRPAAYRAFIESKEDFRPRLIAFGRALDAQGVPSRCDCSCCRPATRAAAVDSAEASV